MEEEEDCGHNKLYMQLFFISVLYIFAVSKRRSLFLQSICITYNTLHNVICDKFSRERWRKIDWINSLYMGLVSLYSIPTTELAGKGKTSWR